MSWINFNDTDKQASTDGWWWWGASIYESTVWATGADYTTLWLAIAAWKTRVLVIADTTETAKLLGNVITAIKKGAL